MKTQYQPGLFGPILNQPVEKAKPPKSLKPMKSVGKMKSFRPKNTIVVPMVKKEN